MDTTKTKPACPHEYEFLRTSKFSEYAGYNTRFIEMNLFYCKKCLKYEEVKREVYSRDTPDWYKG